MIQLAKYELMALDCMGTAVIERNFPMVSLKVGAVVGLYVDLNDKGTDAEFDAAVVDVWQKGDVWLYTLRAVRA